MDNGEYITVEVAIDFLRKGNPETARRILESLLKENKRRTGCVRANFGVKTDDKAEKVTFEMSQEIRDRLKRLSGCSS
jgi:hypothetical protein